MLRAHTSYLHGIVTMCYLNCLVSSTNKGLVACTLWVQASFHHCFPVRIKSSSVYYGKLLQYSFTKYGQQHSQGEQDIYTWAQHGHNQCMCNTHLLGNLGHVPTLKNHTYTLKSLLRPFWPQIPFILCYLYAHFKST